MEARSTMLKYSIAGEALQRDSEHHTLKMRAKEHSYNCMNESEYVHDN